MKVYQIKEFGTLIAAGGSQPRTGDTVIPQTAFKAVWDYLLEFQGKDPVAEKAFRLFTRQGRQVIQARNYAGMVETGDGTVIEILPKIWSPDGETDIAKSKEILIRMIAALRDTPFISIQQASLDVRKNYPLLEVFISAFITECRRVILNGLKKDYIRTEKNSPYLKGRLMISRDIVVNTVNKASFYISSSEYSTDIPRNRIIRSAVIKLAGITISPANRTALRQLDSAIADVPPSPDTEADLRASAVTSRLFSSYSRILEWSALFLRGNAFTPFAGSRISHAMLFPMEQLFEQYIAMLFRRHLQNMNISTQHRRFFLVSSHRGKGRFGLRPDIYAEPADPEMRCFVMDTKWKLIDGHQHTGNYLISQADMYQMYAYGHKYSGDSSEPALLLIYPLNDRFRKPLEPFYYETTEGKNHLRLLAVPFDLTADASSQIAGISASLNAESTAG
ncbi:hypothetical protein D0C36_19400 [Mucilaginibacter conchicola]|uniref:Restriction endonuclease n=1 Tax=Mucilaginibacter conchicola TaxID=2303333 RepID=A0A372NR47_9SPHI|nr:McrC family protein [Mucilaginibacter conchicola]RFZ91110.1 hypothetical protein D0C36_19400 [Mucilaginibacter conchicola]